MFASGAPSPATACLRADWLSEASEGALTKDQARAAVYGMPQAEWKARHQTEATPEQLARMDASVAVEDDSFQTFWRQLARWLVDGAPDRLEIAASPARVAPGEPVTLRAHVSNAFYNDVNNATVSVGVKSPNGTTTTIPLEWSLREDGSYSGSFTPPDSGRYELLAEARFGRDSVETSSTTLLVDDQGADVSQAERRTPLLRRIADETGGRYYDLDGAARLAEDAVFTDAGITVREAKDLWDMPAVFLTLALLLGAEWGYRRWRGLA